MKRGPLTGSLAASQADYGPGKAVTTVLIEELGNGAEYQFTVVALANLNGDEITGSTVMPVVMWIVLAG